MSTLDVSPMRPIRCVCSPLGIVNFEALGFKTGAELLHLLRVRVVFKK